MKYSDVLYDEDYRGPRWRYGMSYRPLSFCTVPKGWIVQSDREDPRFAHGTVDYPRELTADEIESYQLTFVVHHVAELSYEGGAS